MNTCIHASIHASMHTYWRDVTWGEVRWGDVMWRIYIYIYIYRHISRSRYRCRYIHLSIPLHMPFVSHSSRWIFLFLRHKEQPTRRRSRVPEDYQRRSPSNGGIFCGCRWWDLMVGKSTRNIQKCCFDGKNDLHMEIFSLRKWGI